MPNYPCLRCTVFNEAEFGTKRPFISVANALACGPSCGQHIFCMKEYINRYIVREYEWCNETQGLALVLYEEENQNHDKILFDNI